MLRGGGPPPPAIWQMRWAFLRVSPEQLSTRLTWRASWQVSAQMQSRITFNLVTSDERHSADNNEQGEVCKPWTADVRRSFAQIRGRGRGITLMKILVEETGRHRTSSLYSCCKQLRWSAREPRAGVLFLLQARKHKWPQQGAFSVGGFLQTVQKWTLKVFLKSLIVVCHWSESKKKSTILARSLQGLHKPQRRHSESYYAMFIFSVELNRGLAILTF